MNCQQIDIGLIETRGGTQSRAAINYLVVSEYTSAMMETSDFPPVELYYDGEKYWLADGFHRVLAYKNAGFPSVPANVHQGTRRDAILHSVGANSTHGLRRTNEDKRRAVETLLRDDEWGKWSDREIARKTGTDKKTVAKLRSDLSGEIPQIERTVQRNGTVYTQNVANIGRQPVELEDTEEGAIAASVEDALPEILPNHERGWREDELAPLETGSGENEDASSLTHELSEANRILLASQKTMEEGWEKARSENFELRKRIVQLELENAKLQKLNEELISKLKERSSKLKSVAK